MRTKVNLWVPILTLVWLLSGCNSTFGAARFQPIKITTLFVHAWLPELGELDQPAGSIEAGLVQAADLTLRGNFKAAEQLLDELQRKASDDRSNFMIPLFRMEMEKRRYLLLSGGRKIFGSSMLDSMRRDLVNQKRIPTLEQLLNRFSGEAKDDASLALRYQMLLTDALYEMPARIRASNTQAELQEFQGMPSAMQQQAKFDLTILEMLKAESIRLGVLGNVQLQLLTHLILGQQAAANLEIDTAETHYKAAADAANAAGLKHSFVRFSFRLADLKTAPFGDVATFGYNLLSEKDVRLMFMLNVISKTRKTRPPADLEAARLIYLKTGEASAGLKTPGNYHLTIRLAHLARMKHDDEEAIRLYQVAAEQARRDHLLTAAAVAEASFAVLTGSRKVFLQSMKSLVENGDEGAAISIAEMAHTWALTEWLAFNKQVRAIELFRMTGDSLFDNGLGPEAVNPLFDLAILCSRTERAEMSMEVAQEALDLQGQYISRAEKANEEYTKQFPLLTDQAGLRHEQALLSNVFLRLLIELNTKVIEELDSNYWVQRREDAFAALRTHAPKAGFPKEFDQQLRQLDELNKVRAKLAPVFAFESCEELISSYSQVRTQIEQLQDPIMLMQSDGAVGRCDPQRLQQARVMLGQANPLERLRQLLASRGRIPSQMLQIQIGKELMSASIFFDLATAFESYGLLERWVGEMEAIIQKEPSLQRAALQTSVYRAVSMLGNDRPGQARQVLTRMLEDENLQPLLNPGLKVWILNLLLEAEFQLGNHEASLAALERLRFEQERLQELRSGVKTTVRMSAEQAMLERQISNTGKILPGQAARLRELREQSERSQETDQRFPSVEDIRKTLTSLKVGTTVLVYYLAPKGIILWRLAADQPLKAERLKISNAETTRLINKLHFYCAANLEGWEAVSKQLYDALIAPAANIKKGETVVIVASGILSRLPFELLGPSPDTLLMNDHPVVYTNRLKRIRISTPSASAKSRAAVVVGLNRGGLNKAEAEAEKVADILRGKLLIGSQVTSANLFEALKSGRWLHLATHAYLNADNPYLSYLLLAGGEKMEAWQLFRYAPEAEMVVLSACDTKAEAQTLSVRQSMAGDNTNLTAFAFAGGARWVLSSLWRAHDETTAQLMASFYEGLIKEELDPPHALQKAKLAVAKRNRAPFYYAQFFLTASELSSVLEAHQ